MAQCTVAQHSVQQKISPKYNDAQQRRERGITISRRETKKERSGRWKEKETDRHTERKRERETDRQTDRDTYTK